MAIVLATACHLVRMLRSSVLEILFVFWSSWSVCVNNAGDNVTTNVRATQHPKFQLRSVTLSVSECTGESSNLVQDRRPMEEVIPDDIAIGINDLLQGSGDRWYWITWPSMELPSRSCLRTALYKKTAWSIIERAVGGGRSRDG
ncbi:hypothetical protein E6O75_ATG08920 [Venturia nashicola]|uniref:Uncharacterized protein n=1 Tax=Venturia nashicola TaxID=86259 RepID=A0A4Z1P605_9PEZI|nr:hypothetical protein E6O75_ATG08920 [Venturia nashicola]